MSIQDFPFFPIISGDSNSNNSNNNNVSISWDDLADKPFGKSDPSLENAEVTFEDKVLEIAYDGMSSGNIDSLWISTYVGYYARVTFEGKEYICEGVLIEHPYSEQENSYNLISKDNSLTISKVFNTYSITLDGERLEVKEGDGYSLKVEKLNKIEYMPLDDNFISNNIARADHTHEIPTPTWQDLEGKPFGYDITEYDPEVYEEYTNFSNLQFNDGRYLLDMVSGDGYYHIEYDSDNQYYDYVKIAVSPYSGLNSFKIERWCYGNRTVENYSDYSSKFWAPAVPVRIRKYQNYWSAKAKIQEELIPDTIARTSDVYTKQEVINLIKQITIKTNESGEVELVYPEI